MIDSQRFGPPGALAGLGMVLILALTAAPAEAQRRERRRPTRPATPASPPAGKQDGSDLAEEGLYSCRRARKPVSVSFKPEVDLKDLITWAMGFTCKNFVYSAGVGGRSAKITIIAPKKMTPQQAWRVFLVGLQTMNLTVVPKGNVLKILEAPQAKTSSLPLYRRGAPAGTDQLVRMVIRPRHLSADDLTTALNTLKSKDGAVQSLGSSGMVLVTDYGSHIQKMRALIQSIDRPSVGEQLYMIKVKHADVTELASTLTEILGVGQSAGSARAPASRPRGRRGRREPTPAATGSSGSRDSGAAVPSKIMADERISALIVLATEPAYLRVLALVKRLDVPIDIEGAGRIHVYYLDNANAEELAATLTTVISGIQQPTTSRTTAGRRSPARRPATGGNSTGAPAFEGQVRVTHDKPTNALVVVASVKDFLALRAVIRKLDEPRRQVYIEATIMEVNLSSSRDLGVSWHGGTALDSGAILLGGLQHDNLSSINVASLATQTGLLGGAIGPLLDGAETLLGVSIPSYGLLFQALATSSNVNVLSSPHILTTNNEAAEISVGQNIPFQAALSGFPGAGTGAAGGTTGFGFPVQSIQRQDVALTLKITPHINASDMVRLEIDQEINDIADPDFEGNGPSWSKRTIKTTVVVKDQQSIVIGGLMSERDTWNESKIPLLGDVPILGYLFKYTQKTKTKTNLLVLLTPYVIKDQMDIERIVQRKVRERNEFVRSFFNLSKMKYRPNVDYRRKRGLVEEINNTVRNYEREAEILRSLENKRELFPDGLVDFDENGDDGNKNDKKDENDKSDNANGAKKPAEKK